MKKIDLCELKNLQLEILDDIHKFCLNEDITYSLGYGSLLGAVRHKGYIPWDDDIDLIMPREDYERFLSSYQSSRNQVMDLRDNGYSVEMFAKVCRTGTIMTDIVYGRSLWGVNVDIFPIDGIPESGSANESKLNHLKTRLPQICPFYRTIPDGKVFWFIKYIIKRLGHPYFGNLVRLKKQIDELTSLPLKTSSFGSCIMEEGYNNIIPSYVFFDCIDIDFEGRKYKAVSDYDTYLKSIFGDYMKLPPAEEQVTHHLYDSFIL